MAALLVLATAVSATPPRAADTPTGPFAYTRRVPSRVPGGRKLLIGYFYNLYKYDPKGGRTPLPPNVTSPVQLLEQEMDDIVRSWSSCMRVEVPAQLGG